MHIIFFCTLFRAFSFLSVGIRDLASNWDPFNIILLVTGVEVVIGNCLPVVHKVLPNFRNWEEKLSNDGRWCLLPFVLLYLNTCVYLAPLWRYGTSKIMGSRLRSFGGHVTIRLPGVDFLWVVYSDHVSIYHRYGDMSVWSFFRKALPGTEVGRRLVLNIALISYTPLRYVRNVACEE